MKRERRRERLARAWVWAAPLVYIPLTLVIFGILARLLWGVWSPWPTKLAHSCSPLPAAIQTEGRATVEKLPDGRVVAADTGAPQPGARREPVEVVAYHPGGSSLTVIDFGNLRQPTPTQTLIFVHGYHSSSASWTNTWMDLAAELRRMTTVEGEGGQRARAYFVCYPSQEVTALEGGAQAIRDALHAVPLPAGVPVTLIGHSFGGIVLKQFLATDDDDLLAPSGSPPALVTIDTPHHGTQASWLTWFTGESLLRLFFLDKQMQLLPWGAENSPITHLNDEMFRRPLRSVHTITAQFGSSPFTAFLGGAVIAAADGAVPARSAHVQVPGRLPSQPNSYVGGVPVYCTVGVHDYQYTFGRLLTQGDGFHTNVTNSQTTITMLRAIISTPGTGSVLPDCPPVETAGTPWYWVVALMLLPVAITLGVALSGWVVRRQKLALAIVFWAIVGGLHAWIFSYFGTLALYLFLPGLTGVLLAVIQALGEETLLFLWFNRFLARRMEVRENRVRAYIRYGLLFGLTVGMGEQVLYVYDPGPGLDVKMALLRLLLGPLTRIVLGGVLGWVVARHQMLLPVIREKRLDGRRTPERRELLGVWFVPVGLHALHSAVFLQVTGLRDALLIWALVAGLAFAGWRFSRAGLARRRSGPVS